ncbi:13840_t:CDS:10 [Dentiscutata erythropus]|uniref:13840_t:CDS:1 n=1 Tax=Dentiscutata erythropus TaxID=1348616 RepID=A0A9N9FCI4_9GLOM|nr:13840_t:CDS:10 [Dentiscutata erythropus]
MRRASRRRVSYVITHNKDDHGHLLGINSLALDITTPNPETGKPEGILYSAGRDGVIASWDLHLPFRNKKNVNINGSIHKSTESLNEINDVGGRQEFIHPRKNWEIDDEIDFSSQPPSTFRQSFQSHTDWVNDIILCHNNESLISASSDCKINLWHPHKSNSHTPHTIGCHTDYVKTLAYAPGPGWVASGGFDRKIIMWDIKECRPLSFGISSINIDYERPPIATIADSSLKLSVYALACNPIGTVLASGSPEKVVRLWDPRTTKQITSFTGHTDNIRAILVSDDGELVLSGSSDTTIKLWSLKAQRCINTFTVHSDSVWSLYSDHPRLESFYSGCKDGLVAKIDYSGCAEIRDGECVAVCKEEFGVVKLIALDNKYIWTATSDSSIKRWLDAPPRRIRKAISQSSSPSISPTSPQLSPPLLTIPSSSIINLTSAGVSYGVTLDAEVATLYSVTTDDQKLESLDIEDPIPLRDSPDSVIKGQHGLVKCSILNNRRHIITLDNSGECIRVKTFGKRDFNEVVQAVNTIEYIPTWCEVDTRIGALTVHLDEKNCFDAEAYADELDLLEDADIRDDQRINLGKWVLRNLFANFTRTLIQMYEEFPAQNLLRHQLNDFRREFQDDRSLPLQPISFPPATVQAIVNSALTAPPTVATAQSVNSPSPSTSALPQSPTTPLAAFTGPLTAPATTGSQQPDYFSGSHHNSPTSPTGPSGNLTPPGSTGSEPLGGQLPTSEVIKPPPPALINQTSSSSGTSSSLFGRFKPSFGRSKIPKTPNTETKPESSGTNVSSENNSDAKTDSKPAASTQSQDEPSAQIRKDEESKANSPAKSKVQVQHTGYHPIHHDQIHSIRNIRPYVQPPFVQLPISETPEIQIPLHTTVIISEVSPEASTFVDSYRGTVETMDKDVELIEHKAHPWLLEFLLKNKIALKDSVKIGFILKPHEGSQLEDLPNGNSRLTANRMLRARKILSYIVEKLELDQPEGEKDEVIAEKTLIEKDEEKTKSSIKPEMWLELVCLDQTLPPTMTLAAIKSHIWKQNGDLVMTYRYLNNSKKN